MIHWEYDVQDNSIQGQMNENKPPSDMGLTLYQSGNTPSDMPVEETLKTFNAMEIVKRETAADSTRRLEPVTFDKQALPSRIQFLVRESGSILEKAARAPLVVGRHNSTLPVDIDLSDFNAHEMGISRNHFRIEPAPGGKLMVIDLKTVNGTRLNGQTMTPMKPYELRHGDEIKAGLIHLKVSFIY